MKVKLMLMMLQQHLQQQRYYLTLEYQVILSMLEQKVLLILQTTLSISLTWT
ncbi:hypothetical protein D9M68_346740 [compost metagenome]